MNNGTNSNTYITTKTKTNKFIIYSFLLILLSTSNLPSISSSLYFDISSTRPTCFNDEFHKGKVAIIQYQTINQFDNSYEHAHSPLFTFTITEHETNKHKEALQGIKLQGKVYFIIPKSMFYNICVKGNPDSYLFRKEKSVQISMSILTNDKFPPFFYENKIPKDKDFKKFTDLLDSMTSNTIDILKGQAVSMTMEEEFSDFQKISFHNLLIFTVIQIICIVILSVWQVYSIRDIFKNH